MPSQKTALNIMIGLLCIVMLFHFLIVLQLIPYTVVWAGKINTLEEMVVFETISILINSCLLLVFLFKANYIKSKISVKILDGIIWFFVVVFALNTIGNFFSKSWIELVFGTGLTLISSLLCWRIVRRDKLHKS